MSASLARSSSPFLALKNSHGPVALRYPNRPSSPTALKVKTDFSSKIDKLTNYFDWYRRVRTQKVPIENPRNPAISAPFGTLASVLRLLWSALEEWAFLPPSRICRVWNGSVGSNLYGDVRQFQERRWRWRQHVQVLPQSVRHWQPSFTSAVLHATSRVQIQEAKVAQSHPHWALYPFYKFQRR